LKTVERRLLERLAARLRELSKDMLQAEASLLDSSLPLHKNHRRSARNLTHYMALRRHDLRELQASLASIGLSSLGRTESHVFSAIENVYRTLRSLLGAKNDLNFSDNSPITLREGSALLNRNTTVLLGKSPSGRKVRIMVTVPTEAATDYQLVQGLVRRGMDCMRINCAHDRPEDWLGMIRNLKKAERETSRSCCIEMDLAGPKLRTGPVELGPSVLRCHPERDHFGRVVKPARICLEPIRKDKSLTIGIGAPTLQVPQRFLSKLRHGDIVQFHDARDANRSLRIVTIDRLGCWAETDKTVYFVPGLKLRFAVGENSHLKGKKWSGYIGVIPSRPQRLLLKPGEILILTRSVQPGAPARRDTRGRIISPARIGVTLPNFLKHVKVGEPIWFDDGKIGGVVRAVGPESVRVKITQARAEGERLGEGKGINLPETKIDIPALTVEDLEHLKFIVKHADLVGYSFVRTEEDVQKLLTHLRRLRGTSLGIVLKVETREAFENLPNLLLAAMRMRAIGVMIARGDLAVECGYQRLAEVQEEILWICEAAHVPVIWATQVLESLSKKGIPSRSEITDAAMGERAECVMLNKGPYVIEAVKALDNILKRMQAHQEKKRSMLRKLRVASVFMG
jgi:pyruvate kinase